MKHKCPRCNSKKSLTKGVDHWADDDVVTYLACLACNLLFWYSSYLKKVDTNWKEAA